MRARLERIRLHRPQRHWHWRPIGEAQRFLLLSILIGMFAGLLVVSFHIAIEFVGWSTLGSPRGESPLLTLVVPALGALLSVFLISRVFPAARGSGVNDTKAAVYVSDGFVPAATVVGKFLACALAIGTGNSLGPEDPSLHMGAGVASLLGRVFRLTRDNMRRIAPVGAAAGLAAAFNTPITAVLFVIEEVVAGWSGAVLGSIVLSAVSAAVVLRWFLGSQPLFLVPEFELGQPSELLICAVVGVAGGLLAAVFIKAVEQLRKRLRQLPANLHYVHPAAAGLLVGFAGLWLPQVMGAGYSAIDAALHDRFGWQMMLLLAGAKLLATLLCFSARTPGGMFAPTLFTGAMLGGGIGALAQLHWAAPATSSGAYVLVGMGTFFAGVFRAPMTSIFMVFEVSGSYVIILPVMVANTVAYLLSRRLQPVPFFAMLARDEGLDLPSLEEQRDAPTLRVEDAMLPPPRVVLHKDTPVEEALLTVDGEGPVLVDEFDGHWSHVCREDLEGALRSGRGGHAVANAVPLDPLPRVYPDLALDSALRALGSHSVLPVSSRSRPYTLVGTLTLADVHRAYGIRR